MRGRNNNTNNSGNRKGPNPLTRSYESSGPDVKIRGNAHHVAEKYLQLARDAQSSGDPVAAESYLQHAEHYFRLIASAQQAQSGFSRQPDAVDAEGEDDDDSGIPDRFASPPVAVPQVPQAPSQPYAGDRQPYVNGERPAYGGDRQPSQAAERQPYGERPAYNGERPQQDRGPYGQRDRNNQDRNGAGRRPYRDGGDRNQEVRGGDDRNAGRFDNRNRQDRGYDSRNGQGYDNRNGQDRGPDRSYAQPQVEPARDPYAGEQPRIDPPERQAESVMPPQATLPVTSRAEFVPRAEPTYRPEPTPRAEPLQRAEPMQRAEPVQQAEPVQRAEPALRSAPAAVDEAPGLPSFITTPTRAAPIEAPSPAPDLATTSAFPGDDAGEVTKFPRRRRRPTRAAAAEAGEISTEPPGSND